MVMIEISQFYSVNSHFDVNISTSSRDEFMNVWVFSSQIEIGFEKEAFARFVRSFLKFLLSSTVHQS